MADRTGEVLTSKLEEAMHKLESGMHLCKQDALQQARFEATREQLKHSLYLWTSSSPLPVSVRLNTRWLHAFAHGTSDLGDDPGAKLSMWTM
eukprot:1160342-Pelagomonas_calceolata.AAC.1